MSIIYGPKGRAKEYALLAINHYRGCEHGCAYCYARRMAERYKWPFDKPEPRVDLVELEKEADKLRGTRERILLSFMSDPYPLIDAGSRYPTIRRSPIYVNLEQRRPTSVIRR